jgi:hypothetical protein
MKGNQAQAFPCAAARLVRSILDSYSDVIALLHLIRKCSSWGKWRK